MKLPMALIGCIALIQLLATGQRAWAQGEESAHPIRVGIARPGEGETFYVGPDSLLYSIPINGWAFADECQPPEIDVRLEIIRDQTLIGTAHTRPGSDGTYSFSATVNPHGLLLNIPDPTCEECHFASELALIPGPLLLRVIATDPQGATAQQERHIVVDQSSSATLTVQLVAEDGGALPAGLPVTAATWLYYWRARYGTGLTGLDGQATLQIEALSEAPTDCSLSLRPTIVDGVAYESIEPARIVLPPGSTHADPVTLRVRASRGQIRGSLVPHSGSTIPVQAIRVPDGFTYETHTDTDGRFAFSELAVATYLIAPDIPALAERGLVGRSQEVDLTKSTAISASLSLTSAEPGQLQVVIGDSDGSPPPFGWVTVQENGHTRGVSPLSGSVRLFDLPPEPVTVIVIAPGYYSQAHVATPGEIQELSIQLVDHPDRRHNSWGNGELIIPLETVLTEGENGRVSLLRGWLWGQASGSQPPGITTGPFTVIVDGDFALENLPDSDPWLYVLEGETTVRRGDEGPLSVGQGQMLALTENAPLIPVPLSPDIVTLLQGEKRGAPAPTSWQPTLASRFRDQLAQMGVTTAQLITFVIHFFILLSLFVAPFAGVYWWLKRRLSTQEIGVSRGE